MLQSLIADAGQGLFLISTLMHLLDIIRSTYNELSVLLLESLVSLTQLVGHQLVLIPLLLTRVQLFRQNQESFFLTLQLPLTNQELHIRKVWIKKKKQKNQLAYIKYNINWLFWS